MKKKKTVLILFIIVISMVFSVSFSGCISNNNLNNVADVRLEEVSHHETFALPTQYVSIISLAIQNKGNKIADNVKIHVKIHDNDGNELYDKEEDVISLLNPEQVKVELINVPYDLDEIRLNLDITVSWDGGVNQYNRSFEPEFNKHADVFLVSLTHHENYNLSNKYTSEVSFVFQNKGNMIAENVNFHVSVYDNNGNEEYNKEEGLTPLFLPWEVKIFEITVPYDFDDTLLDFSITVSWDGGVNHYTRSFEPEFNELADVKLDSMFHYEYYKLAVGYMSTVSFIFQNKGSVTADNVKIHVTVYDNDGNEEYNEGLTSIPFLLPGEIKFHEITTPYDFDDARLDLNITISWDGGTNHYTKSFEPKITF